MKRAASLLVSLSLVLAAVPPRAAAAAARAARAPLAPSAGVRLAAPALVPSLPPAASLSSPAAPAARSAAASPALASAFSPYTSAHQLGPRDSAPAAAGLPQTADPRFDGARGRDDSSEPVVAAPARGGWLRVLPDPERNRAFWRFALGQGLATMAGSFQSTALPSVLASASERGLNSAAKTGAQAVSSLTTGGLVDRRLSFALNATYVGRFVSLAAIAGLTPVVGLGLWGVGAYALVFTALTAAAGFLQATSLNAGNVALTRMISDDERLYNRANAVVSIVCDVFGFVGPLLAAAFIGWSAAALFPLAAPLLPAAALTPKLFAGALAFGLAGLMLGLVALGYWRTLRMPKDPVLDARARLEELLRELKAPFVRVSVGREGGATVLLVEAKGDAAAVPGAPLDFDGLRVKIVAERRMWREFVEGLGLAWRHRLLRLYVLFGALTWAASEPLFFTVLPSYLDTLPKVDGAWGWAMSVAAGALGSFLASLLLTYKKDLGAGKAADPLAAQARWATVARAVSWLVYAAAFAAGTAYAAAGLVLLNALLGGFALIVWTSLLMREIANAFPHAQGKVWAAISLLIYAATLAGMAVFGPGLALLGVKDAAPIAIAVLAACAALDAALAFLAFRRPPSGPEGPSAKAKVPRDVGTNA